MTLSEALDIVYGHVDWSNPIWPLVVSTVRQTPYEAYQELKPDYKGVVKRLIGHEPQKEEE